MKLFDLNPDDKLNLKRFISWHVGYIAYVSLFAFVIYYFHWFKAYWFLREFWILNLLAPLHTLTFIVISPYRRHWLEAIRNMYRSLGGDPVFCLMALVVLILGIYLYNGFIWGLGSLIPSIFFT